MLTQEYTIEITASDKDTHFTDAINQNAVEEENISFNSDWATAQIQKAEVSGVTILSDQQLDWELQFYSKDTQSDTNADTDSLITSIVFNSTNARQNADTGLWRYDGNPAFLPFYYHDQDNTGEWHLSLVNRSITAKTAGAAGEVVVKISARPIL